MQDEPSEISTSHVRLFPDYAGSVIWFPDPVDYAESRLSASLVAALEAWERSYYDALTPELDWRSPELARAFTAEGERLAPLLADELGSEFEVENHTFGDGGGVRKTRIRASGSAGNTDAAAAFRARADAARVEWQRLREESEARKARGDKSPVYLLAGGKRLQLRPDDGSRLLKSASVRTLDEGNAPFVLTGVDLWNTHAVVYGRVLRPMRGIDLAAPAVVAFDGVESAVIPLTVAFPPNRYTLEARLTIAVSVAPPPHPDAVTVTVTVGYGDWRVTAEIPD